MEEHTEDIAGIPTFWRSAPGPNARTLYLHGVPTSSDDWVPFLERAGGIALDLPGFGRSGKRGDHAYDIPFYDRFLDAFLHRVGLERFGLLVHDWGAVGLALAQRAPERVARLVVMDAVPFLPGYRWHWLARTWRRPLLGELAMGATTAPVARLLSGLPREEVRRFLPHFDQGTQRAILRLYRSAPPGVLAAAGERLGALEAPALVVWGERDRFIDAGFADAYARALGGPAEVLRLPGAGHWPWIERPELVERVVGFLAQGA